MNSRVGAVVSWSRADDRRSWGRHFSAQLRRFYQVVLAALVLVLPIWSPPAQANGAEELVERTTQEVLEAFKANASLASNGLRRCDTPGS